MKDQRSYFEKADFQSISKTIFDIVCWHCSGSFRSGASAMAIFLRGITVFVADFYVFHPDLS